MKKILGIMLAVILFEGVNQIIYADEISVNDNVADQTKTEETKQPEISQVTQDTNIPVTEPPFYQFTYPYDKYDSSIEQWPQPDAYTEDIHVENIVVSEFKNEMNVKDTQNISATVLPATATKSALSYVSSNSSVATVDPIGKVTAVGKGTCTITVEADGYKTYLDLNVKVKTAGISVGKIFVTMKLDQTYQLSAKAVPDDASQELKYKSSDENVVTVDENGLITAKKTGEATIIVSNDDSVTSVNIIVNSHDKNSSEDNISDSNNNNPLQLDEISQKIENSSENIIVIKDVKNITSEVLKQLYGTPKSLLIECEGYDIIINGKDIRNVENELSTEIDLKEENNGTELFINHGKSLPGKIKIDFNKDSNDYKYMYIYNDSESEYEMVNSLLSKDSIEVDYNGKYLLTNNKIRRFKVNVIIISIAGGIILILTGIYIFIKKRYLFW